MNIAIMQPCYLPWRGYFSLMKLADVFVHLDDVPLPMGRSYQTRVAIKTSAGRQWLTVPVRRRSNQLIRDVEIMDGPWRGKHLKTLHQHFGAAANIVADIYDRVWTHVSELNIALAGRVADALGISNARTHMRSSDYRVPGTGWAKILNICLATGATRYITGHGARHYLNHEAFERAGVEVLYLDYDLSPYPQPNGAFDPYVSALDLLAHAQNPSAFINAALVPWQTFTARANNALTPDMVDLVQT